MLQHVMSSADVFATCMQGLGIGEKILGVLYNKLNKLTRENSLHLSAGCQCNNETYILGL